MRLLIVLCCIGLAACDWPVVILIAGDSNGVALASHMYGVVSVARSGSKLEDWQKGSELYRKVLAHNVKGLVFIIGTNDTGRRSRVEQWPGRLLQFISDIRADLKRPDLPIVVSRLGPDPKLPAYPNWRELDELQAGMRLPPNVAFIQADDLTTQRPLHFDAEGLSTIASRATKGLAAMGMKK